MQKQTTMEKKQPPIDENGWNGAAGEQLLLAMDNRGGEMAAEQQKQQQQQFENAKNPQNCMVEEQPKHKGVKFAVSLGVVVGVAASWACGTQFRKSTMVIDPAHFYAPFSMVWFSTSFMVLCYPTFIFYALLAGKSVKQEYQNALKVFGGERGGFCIWSFLWRETLFLTLWTVINYAYAQSLGLISASATASIMSSNTAFVCVLGWVILREPFSTIKILAVLLAIAGVVVVSMDAEFAGSPVGIALVVASAIFAAFYKVLFKLLNRQATLGQVSLFMSGLGLWNFALNAPIMLLLLHLGWDHFSGWTFIPWWPLLGSAFLGLVFNFLVNFGIVLLDPLVISVGMIFGMPLSAGIDLLFRSMRVSTEFLVGSALILLSFLLIAFPVESALKKCYNNRQRRELNNKNVIEEEENGSQKA